MTEYALYIDDSGHPVDQPYVIATGFVSTEERWLKFEKEWDAALSSLKIRRPFSHDRFHVCIGPVIIQAGQAGIFSVESCCNN